MAVNLHPSGQKCRRFFSTFHDYLTLASAHNHFSIRHHPKPRTFNSSRPRRWTSTTSSVASSSLLQQQHKTQQQHQQTPPSKPSAPQTQTQTLYSLFPTTLPLGAPPNGPFDLDSAALHREFLSLQSRAHPDMHPSGPDKARAEGMSARINDAYRTLLSPLRRAEYILSLQKGQDGEDGGGQERVEGEEDGGFLAEVLDIRESIEGAGASEEVEELGRENEERVRRCEETVGGLLQEGRWEEARKEVARLRYWVGIRDVVREWGEGK